MMTTMLRLSASGMKVLCLAWAVFGLTIPSRCKRPKCSRGQALQMKISEGTASRAAKAFAPMQREASGHRPRVTVESWLLGAPGRNAQETPLPHWSSAATPSADLAYCSSFEVVWNRQKALLAERSEALRALPGRGIVLGEVCPLDDYLILVQHSAVFTLGTSTQAADLAGLIPAKATSDDATIETDNILGASNSTSSSSSSTFKSVDIVKVDRGGEATWHGPGQLVAYPVLDLRRYQKDAHWYLRALEEVGLRAATAATLHALDRAVIEGKDGNSKSDSASAASIASSAAKPEGALAAESTHTESFGCDASNPIGIAAQLEQRWGLRFGRVPGYTGVWCFTRMVDGTGVSALGESPSETLETGPEQTGVVADAWSKPVKVMATGVAVKRWVTQHGLALNCDCDLAWASPSKAASVKSRSSSSLDETDGAASIPAGGSGGHAHIVPCGISDMKVGSLSGVIADAWDQWGCVGAPPSISVLDAAPHLLHAFEEVLGCDCASGVQRSAHE